jgi:hypothetical protein
VEWETDEGDVANYQLPQAFFFLLRAKSMDIRYRFASALINRNLQL